MIMTFMKLFFAIWNRIYISSNVYVHIYIMQCDLVVPRVYTPTKTTYLSSLSKWKTKIEKNAKQKTKQKNCLTTKKPIDLIYGIFFLSNVLYTVVIIIFLLRTFIAIHFEFTTTIIHLQPTLLIHSFSFLVPLISGLSVINKNLC